MGLFLIFDQKSNNKINKPGGGGVAIRMSWCAFSDKIGFLGTSILDLRVGQLSWGAGQIRADLSLD